jgi:hypothetical protein
MVRVLEHPSRLTAYFERHPRHEFLSALAENRDPYPNAVQSANWTCVGICAHQSALKGGDIVKLPAFTLMYV